MDMTREQEVDQFSGPHTGKQTTDATGDRFLGADLRKKFTLAKGPSGIIGTGVRPCDNGNQHYKPKSTLGMMPYQDQVGSAERYIDSAKNTAGQEPENIGYVGVPVQGNNSNSKQADRQAGKNEIVLPKKRGEHRR